MAKPGEPLWLPEDLGKMHALWLWRREHCQACHQHRADWLGPDGVELRDPPFEVREVFCPPCGALQDWRDDAPKDKGAMRGIHPYVARLDPPDEP